MKMAHFFFFISEGSLHLICLKTFLNNFKIYDAFINVTDINLYDILFFQIVE